MKDFPEHFSIETAQTEAQLHEVFALRYRVYCQKLGYEDAARFPDGLETDRFDAYSKQVLIRHLESGKIVGCQRFVQGSNGEMPVESVCGPAPTQNRADWAEFSRIISSPYGITTVAQRQLVFIGLLIAWFALSKQHGVHYICGLIERSFLRHLRAMGMDIEATGDAVNYHGVRLPVALDIGASLKQIQQSHADFYHLITHYDGIPDTDVDRYDFTL